MYPKSPDFFQEILKETFGAKQFSTSIIDRVKTFEDALDELDNETKRFYESFDWSQLTDDEAAYRKLKIIIKAINEKFVPDFTNDNQAKWYPWFKINKASASAPSGFGFSDSYYRCTSASTIVGSRLCFENKEKCEYVATQFTDLYKQFLML